MLRILGKAIDLKTKLKVNPMGFMLAGALPLSIVLLVMMGTTTDGPSGMIGVLSLFFMALLCELIDSSLGMGYGTTLTPLLLLMGYEPLSIVPAVLCSEALTGLGAACMHHSAGNVDFLRDSRAKKTALLLVLLSALGAISAVCIAVSLPTFWLKLAIGTMVLVIGLIIIGTHRHTLKYRGGMIMGLGAVASFNKGFSGGGYGPLVTGGQVVSGMAPRNAVAITSLAEGVTCVIGFGAYLILGKTPQLSLLIPLCLGALLSIPPATIIVKKMPTQWFRTIIGLVTIVLGGITLIKLL